MSEKLNLLRSQRSKKYKEFIETDYKSWKKKLRKLELDNLDLKIKIEKLKIQYE